MYSRIVLRTTTASLMHYGPARRFLRRQSRRVKSTLGYPDAYGDLLAWMADTDPAAVLDIGAFEGDTVERIVDETSVPVHAFEPTPDSYRRLSERFASHPQVTVHPLALARVSGGALLYLNANRQTNSLLDNVDNLDTEHRSFARDLEHVGQVTVRTMALDDWVERFLPTGDLVVKADVQGAEADVIAGGQSVFRERVTAFYSEAQLVPMYAGQADFGAIHRTLTEELGFVLMNLYPCLHDEWGRATQTDALWVRESRLLALPR